MLTDTLSSVLLYQMYHLGHTLRCLESATSELEAPSEEHIAKRDEATEFQSDYMGIVYGNFDFIFLFFLFARVHQRYTVPYAPWGGC